ncbi:MAG: Gfo/Idh/MocA family oxidoreductase [Verrucomicrobia bacterium]|nr:Gfo/Idh/MocA family oxidoreductase [Verrucomicrobiota bacterium]
MDKVRIGLIGASGRAILAQHWHTPLSRETEVVAASDPSPASLDHFRSWAGKDAFTTDDYRDVIARDDVDAIAIFSPDNFHEEQTLAALEAGKHVFLEKPMAITTEGCDRILRAWRDAGTHLMIGFNMRHMPVCLKAKQLVDDGAIGELKNVWIRHFIGAGSDFYFHDWHALSANINSLLLQKASHDFDMIHWFADAYAVRVSAFGGRDYFGDDKDNKLTCVTCDERDTCPEAQSRENPRQACVFRREVNIEDNAMVIMELANGVRASYLQCHFTPEYLRNYTLIGTKGRIEMNVERNELLLIRRYGSRCWEKEPEPERIDLGEYAGSHGGADPIIAKSFLKMLTQGVEPVSHPVAGRMSVAVGCEATTSMRQGGIRIVPPLDL